MAPKLLLNRVVGYIRVSTDDQAESGAGLDAQRASIEAECQRRGWELVDIVADPAISGGVPFSDRPGGAKVLEMLRARQVDGLVVPKLDRLTRSTGDAETILELFKRRDWALTVLDLGVDTSTPMGEAMAGVVAVFAKLERRLIGLRTREALAAKKAAGVRLGRPPSTAQETEDFVVALRISGATLRSIAEQLEAAEVPCAQGGSWHVSTVRRILGRHVSELPTFRRGPRPAVQPT